MRRARIAPGRRAEKSRGVAMTGCAGHRAAIERMTAARALTAHQIQTVRWQITRAAQIVAEQAARRRWRTDQDARDWSPLTEPSYWTALSKIAARRGSELAALGRRLDRQDAALTIYRRKHVRADRPHVTAAPALEHML